MNCSWCSAPVDPTSRTVTVIINGGDIPEEHRRFTLCRHCSDVLVAGALNAKRYLIEFHQHLAKEVSNDN